MSNSAEQLLYHAVLLLEEQEDVVGAISALNQAIAVAEVAKHHLEFIRAKTLLAELLAGMGHVEEAAVHFEDVIRQAAIFPDDPSLIDEELAAAREFLEGEESSESSGSSGS